MSKISTLIFLINQINKDYKTLSVLHSSEEGEETCLKDKKGLFAPPQESVNAILNYAKSLEVKETEAVGKVEWVLN
ncbi:MAG: hypothetical protein FWG22_00020 [Prolixibacteraceae bacterium]|nr:hypothetical protein [Prolixibacteraceae bacterium]